MCNFSFKILSQVILFNKWEQKSQASKYIFLVHDPGSFSKVLNVGLSCKQYWVEQDH